MTLTIIASRCDNEGGDRCTDPEVFEMAPSAPESLA